MAVRKAVERGIQMLSFLFFCLLCMVIMRLTSPPLDPKSLRMSESVVELMQGVVYKFCRIIWKLPSLVFKWQAVSPMCVDKVTEVTAVLCVTVSQSAAVEPM